MPANNIALELIKSSKCPIVAPSANASGKPSGTRLEDIKEELDGKVDAMIDGGDTDVGIESTVVKVIDGIPTILRPGKITPEDIINITGVCKIDAKVMEKVQENDKVESPGMKYKHYAPKTKCVLVKREEKNKQIEKVNKLIKINKSEGKKVCVLGFEEHKKQIETNNFIILGKENDINQISKRIYTSLRNADKLSVDLIIIEGTNEEGMGLAIINRLVRTCEFNVY